MNKFIAFDAAKAAAEQRNVVTASGDIATIIHFNPHAVEGHQVLGYDAAGRARMWNTAGKGLTDGNCITGMVAKESTRMFYVNVYSDARQDSVHDTLKCADANRGEGYLDTVVVSYLTELA